MTERVKKQANYTYVDCPKGCGMSSRPGAMARHTTVCGKHYTVEEIAAYGQVDTAVAEGECWVWRNKKKTVTGGYGAFKNESAHRAIYRSVHGDIPKGMNICHTCDNPPCINPKHLWLGTPKDNRQDQMAKGRFTSPLGDPDIRAKAVSRLPRGDNHSLRKDPDKARRQVELMVAGRKRASKARQEASGLGSF